MDQRLDVARLKAEIRRLADQNWLAKRDQGIRPNVVRYTQLCALRAATRGKLHFSRSTVLAHAYWIFGLPCVKKWTAEHEYVAVDLEVQQAWIKPLLEEFALEPER